MAQKKPPLDIINMVLEECIIAYPVSSFIISLYKQYQQRGSLSKKQLQGLYAKASEIADLAPGKLAGIEAIIKRMPTRDKSATTEPAPVITNDESLGEILQSILSTYPEHKRILFLKAKYDNNENLTAAEVDDIHRINKLVEKKKGEGGTLNAKG